LLPPGATGNISSSAGILSSDNGESNSVIANGFFCTSAVGGACCFGGSEYPGVSSKLANESAAVPPPDMLLLVVEGILDGVFMVDCVGCGIKHVK